MQNRARLKFQLEGLKTLGNMATEASNIIEKSISSQGIDSTYGSDEIYIKNDYGNNDKDEGEIEEEDQYVNNEANERFLHSIAYSKVK